MRVHERVKQYIDDAGIVTKTVAKRSGINAPRLYSYLKGTARMTVDDYETICIHGLNIHPQYFFANKFFETENDVLSSKLYGGEPCLSNGK